MAGGVDHAPQVAKVLFAKAALSNDPDVAAYAKELGKRLRELQLHPPIGSMLNGSQEAGILGFAILALPFYLALPRRAPNSGCLSAAIGHWDAVKAYAGCPF